MNKEYSRYLLCLVFLCSTVRLLSLASNSSNLIVIVSRLLVCHWCIRVHVTLLLQILERLWTSISQVHLLIWSKGLLSLIHDGIGGAGLGRDETCQELLLLRLTIVCRWSSCCRLQRSELTVRSCSLGLGAQQLVGLVLASLRDLLVWKSTIVGVILSRSITAKCVARGHKLSQVTISIFRSRSARYIVFQGQFSQCLLTWTSLLVVKIKLAAAAWHAIFGGLRNPCHARSISLSDCLLWLPQDILCIRRCSSISRAWVTTLGSWLVRIASFL